MACHLAGAKPLSESIVNWNISSKLRWNHNRNSNIFIQENAFESIVWKMGKWRSCSLGLNVFSNEPLGEATPVMKTRALPSSQSRSHSLVTWGLSCDSLHWRYNKRDGVSNHRRFDWLLLNRLFRRRSKKTSKLRVTGLCGGNSPVTGEFPAQRGPVTRKMFPFDDVIM